MQNNHFQNGLNRFVDSYINMKIGNISINCPYWSNKIINGKVTIRGYLNGKGDAKSIADELNRMVDGFHIKSESDCVTDLIKIAKRSRIGIDCSGLVYRLLNFIVQSNNERKIENLDQIFEGGINKTNADKLTSSEYSTKIENIKDIRTGDMIRIMSGKHLLAIIDVDQKSITYLHSSSINTKIKGVHKGKIMINNLNKRIELQTWLEETKNGKSYAKFCREFNNDGVYRLKILR
jgi:hypothetical protein